MSLSRISKLLTVVALAGAFATPGAPWVAMDNQSKEHGKSPSGIDFDSASSGWVVGDHTDHASGKMTAHIKRWDGAKWSDSAIGDLAGKDVTLTQVAAVSGTDAWAAGVPISVAQLRKATRSPRPASALPFRDRQRGLQAGLVSAVGTPYALTRWDGQKWATVAAPQPGADKDALVSDLERVGDHALAVGLERKIDPQTGVPSEQVGFLDRYAGGAVQRLALPTELTAKPSAVFSVTGAGANDVWISGAFVTPEKDTPYAAHWNGTTWTVHELPVTATFPNGWNADQIVTMGGTVYVSGRSLYEDGTLTTGYRFDGKAWTEWTGRGLAEINDLSVRSDNRALVAGGWPTLTSNISQYATFDGTAWTSHEQPAALAGKDGQVLGVAYLPGTDRAMGVGYTNDDSEWGGAYYVTASRS
ncbi:hypothetical protein NLX83_38540 [Allokutzneria sp. A3M-2-11 16]|uniref:hypothetical protein n=1 Tax=Allokutzneria sp. A3M-2-11 16 TaxID=2962043 RepID=UPI0020B75B46|nr:hypothetical protein [Allokutzneria sp. A3M-2-11 16]MCP3805179.1 hypothetical protein [Allokutzneria sp. A3M-2-11 16]